MNSSLREQLEESHHMNEALTNDLQKLTNDWETLREEMIIKEDEWKDEEQVSFDVFNISSLFDGILTFFLGFRLSMITIPLNIIVYCHCGEMLYQLKGFLAKCNPQLIEIWEKLKMKWNPLVMI